MTLNLDLVRAGHLLLLPALPAKGEPEVHTLWCFAVSFAFEGRRGSM